MRFFPSCCLTKRLQSRCKYIIQNGKRMIITSLFAVKWSQYAKIKAILLETLKWNSSQYNLRWCIFIASETNWCQPTSNWSKFKLVQIFFCVNRSYQWILINCLKKCKKIWSKSVLAVNKPEIRNLTIKSSTESLIKNGIRNSKFWFEKLCWT